MNNLASSSSLVDFPCGTLPLKVGSNVSPELLIRLEMELKCQPS